MLLLKKTMADQKFCLVNFVKSKFFLSLFLLILLQVGQKDLP